MSEEQIATLEAWIHWKYIEKAMVGSDTEFVDIVKFLLDFYKDNQCAEK